MTPTSSVRPPGRTLASRCIALGALTATSLSLVAFGPTVVQAQESDFLFRSPRVTLALHGGFYKAGANSQVFDFTTRNLTVNPGDFDSPAYRGELSVRIADNLDLSVDAAWSTSEVTSEPRLFVGSDDLPILQTTSFSQTPVSINLKYYLNERGRSVGNFAWIPRRFSAYVGAGAGWAKYSFDQTGEFVTCEIDGSAAAIDDCLLDGELVPGAVLPIRFGQLESSSSGTLAQVLVGAEFAFTPRAIVILDGRYRWAAAEMRDDWFEFDDIDLSGFSLSLGLGLRL